MANADVNALVLRQIMTYDPATGIFNRRNNLSMVLGRIATKGYRQISVMGTRYMAHRLAWLYIYGEWPTDQIDHINQTKDDNRIDNLRIVTNKQNGENTGAYSSNTSGVKGVRFKGKAWLAEIKHHGVNQHLGSFESKEDAQSARITAESILFTHATLTHNITHTSLKPLFMRSSIEAPGTKTE